MLEWFGDALAPLSQEPPGKQTALSIINTTSSIFDPIIELEREVFKMNGSF